jgi:hypothetical protein
MPSSISSSDPRRWAQAWVLALVFAAAGLLAYERYWRAQGLEPGVIDSPQLWSAARDAVRERSVVFLGASRTVYGIDPQTWRRERPGDDPVMLAVNGHYPVAALQDLARDERFRGTVIVDIDSYGLLAAHHDMQQPWVDFHRQRWNWNWRWHRQLLNHWQAASVLSNPGIALVPLLKRTWARGAYQPPYSQSFPDRTGYMRFEKVDTTALAAHFDGEIDWKIARFPAPSPADFLSQAAPVVAAADAIRARGGEVVFVTLPVQGRLVEMETRYMPRAQYWDAFAALPGVHAVHYEDVPEWRGLVLPDRSHVTREGRAVLTAGLVAELRRHGWLP